MSEYYGSRCFTSDELIFYYQKRAFYRQECVVFSPKTTHGHPPRFVAYIDVATISTARAKALQRVKAKYPNLELSEEASIGPVLASILISIAQKEARHNPQDSFTSKDADHDYYQVSWPAIRLAVGFSSSLRQYHAMLTFIAPASCNETG